MMRNIGIPNIEYPKQTCKELNCPYHGTLKVRGRIMQGEVVSTKMQNTVVIKLNYNFFIRKYQRYERRNKKQAAHKPGCIDVQVGDTVRIMECHPLCKTVAFVVIDVVKRASENSAEK